LGAALQADGEYEVRVYGLKHQKEKRSATASMNGQDFAALFERAIERSGKRPEVKQIECSAISRKENQKNNNLVQEPRPLVTTAFINEISSPLPRERCKIGAALVTKSAAPIFCPHPPTPPGGWGRHYPRWIVAVSGRKSVCDHEFFWIVAIRPQLSRGDTNRSSWNQPRPANGTPNGASDPAKSKVRL